MVEGLEKVMWLPLGLLTMLASQRPPVGKSPPTIARNPAHMERPDVGTLGCSSAIRPWVPDLYLQKTIGSLRHHEEENHPTVPEFLRH